MLRIARQFLDGKPNTGETGKAVVLNLAPALSIVGRSWWLPTFSWLRGSDKMCLWLKHLKSVKR